MFSYPRTIFYEILSESIEKSSLSLCDKKQIIGNLCILSREQNKLITLFYNHIFNNMFTSDLYKDMCLTYFCIAQNKFKSLEKLGRRFKINKMSFKNTHDLVSFDEINDIKSNLKITLIENNSKYCFKIVDIICIINNALLFNTSNFYSEPTSIKNPYTNMPFLEHTLYNIYFYIKNSSFIMPTLLHLFMQSGFDLKEFSANNEPLLRDMLINNYINTLNTKTYIKEIKKMFKDSSIIGVKNSKRLKDISPNMPADIIIDIFKPFVKTYLYAIYSLNYTKKFQKRILLYKKITGFLNENPQFGRKIIHTKKIKRDIFVFGAAPYSPSGFNINVKNKFSDINIENICAAEDIDDYNGTGIISYINYPEMANLPVITPTSTPLQYYDNSFVLNQSVADNGSTTDIIEPISSSDLDDALSDPSAGDDIDDHLDEEDGDDTSL